MVETEGLGASQGPLLQLSASCWARGKVRGSLQLLRGKVGALAPEGTGAPRAHALLLTAGMSRWLGGCSCPCCIQEMPSS